VSDERAGWDQRYRDAPDALPSPAAVLRDYVHLLPSQGRALDLACGRGGNALLLARAGLAVDAWDLSAVAIAQLAAAAAREGLAVATQVRDVVAEPPPPACYDAITVGYFLDRRIAPAIVTALQPGGLLFYQTFGPERVGDRGPRNPAYRLETGELLRLFAQLRVHLYREDGVAGDPARGLRGEVQFIGARI
jgi:SAM-dependent methyltransferase